MTQTWVRQQHQQWRSPFLAQKKLCAAKGNAQWSDKDCRGMDVWNGRKLTWTCRYCSLPFDTGYMWTAATTHICTAVTPEIPATEWCCQPFVSLFLHLEYLSSSVYSGMHLEQGWPLDHAPASSVIYLCVLMWCSLALNFWFHTFNFLSVLCISYTWIAFTSFI